MKEIVTYTLVFEGASQVADDMRERLKAAVRAIKGDMDWYKLVRAQAVTDILVTETRKVTL